MNAQKILYHTIIALFGILSFAVLSKWLGDTSNSELTGIKVVLEAKVLKDDVFQLLYWERSEEKFKIENSVRTKVKGNKEFQEIVFELPDLIDLYRLRLDIGENEKQQKVTIRQLEFSSDQGDREFDVDEFNRLFSPNKYIRTDNKGVFIGLKGASGEKSFYDPHFVSNDNSKEIKWIRGARSWPFNTLTALVISLSLMFFLFKTKERMIFSIKEVFAVVFMLILLLPTFQTKIVLLPELENLEKRELAEMPEFSFSKKFVKDFEAYFDDNFGFRNRLVSWGGAYKTKIFRASKNPDLVMFGKGKWLFYNRRVGNTRMYKSYTRTNLLTPDTLKLLVDTWEKRKQRYESEGKKYLLVFWPNKHSIYPERMSDIMKSQIKDTISRVDQILQYLEKVGSDVNLTDVRPRLLEEKFRHQVYHKFDSHWNDYGAFIGYQDFFEQNLDYLNIRPKSIGDFEVTWSDYYGGELIQLLGVRNKGFFKEKIPKFDLKPDSEGDVEYLSTEGFPRLSVRTRYKAAGNKLRALIFRDSFTNSLEQFFSLHFYEVTYIWQSHNPYYINKLKPDIIIDGYVEREIGNKVD